MRKAYVDIPDGQMHYRYAGFGEAVILLHMSGSSSEEYEAVGKILSEKYAVYALDLLAFGGSDRPPRFYSFADHAKTVISFMDALGIEKAYFVGSLVGANISVHIASTYPDRVLGLMLGQLCYYKEDPEHFIKLRNAPVFKMIDITDDGAHMMEIWKRSAKYGESAEISNARAIALHQAAEYGESLHWALCEDEGFEERLLAVKVPTVLVNYAKSGNVEGIKHVLELIPGSVYEYIENATPYVTRAMPEVFAGIFLKYFSK